MSCDNSGLASFGSVHWRVTRPVALAGCEASYLLGGWSDLIVGLRLAAFRLLLSERIPAFALRATRRRGGMAATRPAIAMSAVTTVVVPCMRSGVPIPPFAGLGSEQGLSPPGPRAVTGQLRRDLPTPAPWMSAVRVNHRHPIEAGRRVAAFRRTASGGDWSRTAEWA